MSAVETADIRVLADDLTGALDSAVSFASSGHGIGVSWNLERKPSGRMAIDVATREGSEAEAVARHKKFARWLAGGDLSFKKIDSLLRGHVATEIEASILAGAYKRVVVAPAFPFQGRITRRGRQWRLDRMEMVGPDLVADLSRRLSAGHAGSGPKAIHFVTLYDAETDADLDDIVATSMLEPRTLWVGTGGLAAALARHRQAPRPAAPGFSAPFVGLVGTDHDVTLQQVTSFAIGRADAHIVVDSDIDEAKNRLAKRMMSGEPSIVSIVASGDRQVVAGQIDRVFAKLLDGLPRPGTLLVTGGETLRSVCDSLGAIELIVESEIEPGLPISRIKGGVFDGLVTISKSGAFGDRTLLRRLSDLVHL